MPTYEYACDGCPRVFEVRQRISDPPLATCEVCGGSIRRLISSAPFILKGGGWYVTDYPSESRKKAMEADKPAAPSTATDGKPEPKPSGPKTEVKSSTATDASPTSSASAASTKPG